MATMMPQGATGTDTNGLPPAPPDLTGTQGNTPGGMQGAILWLISKMIGPGGALAPNAAGAPSAMRPAPPRPLLPQPAGGAAMGPPYISNAMGDVLNAATRGGSSGLPPPAAMPGDPASGASAVRPGMSAADFARLVSPQGSYDRTMARPTGASLGAPGITPPMPLSPQALAMRQILKPGQSVANTAEPIPGALPPRGAPPPGAAGSMIADAIARMVPPARAGVPVTPGMVDPRLAAARVPRPGSAGYVVRPGDTLSGIAQRTQGAGSRFPAIAARNPQIGDVNRIFPGQRLNIPSGPAVAGQVVGIDRGTKNHPAGAQRPAQVAGKKKQAPSGAAKLKSGFLAAAQGSPSQKASGRVKRPAYGGRPTG